MTFIQRSALGLLFCLIMTVNADAQKQLHNPQKQTGYWKPASGLFEFPIPNSSVAMKTNAKVKNHLANWTDFDGDIDVDVYVTPNLKEDPLSEEFVLSVGEKPMFVGKQQKGTELMKPVFSKKGTPKLAEGCYSMQPVPGVTYYDIMVFAYYPKQQELYQFVMRINKDKYRIPDAREHLRRIRFGPDVAPLPADVALIVPEPKAPEILPSDLANWTSDDKRFEFLYPKSVGLKELQIPHNQKDSLLASMSTDKKDLQLSLVRVSNLDKNKLDQDFFAAYISKTFKSYSGLSLSQTGSILICESKVNGEFAGLKKTISLKAIVNKEQATMYVLAVAYDYFDIATTAYAKRILQESRLVDVKESGIKKPEPQNPSPSVPPITPEPKEPPPPPTRDVPNPTSPKIEKPSPPTEATLPAQTPATRTTFWTTRKTLLVVGGVLFGCALLGISAVLLVKGLKSGQSKKSKRTSSSKKKRSPRDD